MASILNNVAALSATRQIGITQAGLKATIERLTTGKRVNRAADDAAGLAQGTGAKLSAIVAHETRKTQNIAYFGAQAQDGYLEEATNLIMRGMELVAGGNGSSSEMGSVDTLAIAAAAKAGVTLASLGTTTASVVTALGTVNTNRSTIASAMAQASSGANLSGIEEENSTATMSQIMDADIGAEVVNLTKWQILNQSGISALSQANQSSQSILALLR